MLRFVARRLLYAIPLLFGITSISFFILQLAPGDYLTQLKMNPQIEQATIRQMEREFGLDQPILMQYLMWLRETARPVVRRYQGIPWPAPKLNLGYSFSYRVPITTLVLDRATNTLLLSLSAMLLAWALAVPLGVYCAVHHGSWRDTTISFASFVGMSLPNFFVAFLLLYLAAATGWLPVGGRASPGHDSMGMASRIYDTLRHLAIPVSVLGGSTLAGLVRLMRGNMLEVLRSDYVTAARAKGLPERVVVYKHALRNAINPFVTMFGYQLSDLFSGAALVEIICSWPGLGQLLLGAVLSQDLYLVMGSLVLGTALLVGGNLLADMLLAVVDPRVRAA